MLQPFLRRSLLARGTGFHFTVPPPPDIADLRHLNDADESMAVGCALANLQQGRFDVATALMGQLRSRNSADFSQMSIVLFGHSAPRTDIRKFLDWTMRRNDDAGDRYRACEAAVASGALWAVPALLDTYVATDRRDLRRYIERALSWLLEEAPGVIDEGADDILPADAELSFGEVPEPQPDVDAYVARVQAQVEALRLEHGLDDHAVVVEGKVLDVHALARRLLQHIVGNPYAARDRVDKGSLLLEAMTGWKFTGFYKDRGAFQPLQAAAAVEAFLDAQVARRFQPGVRYFFGHPIPE